MERDPTVISSERSRSGEHNIARSEELLEHRRRIIRHARREHVRLPRARRQRDSRELLNHGVDAVQATQRISAMRRLSAAPSARADVLPVEQESRVRVLRGGLDFATQCRECAGADAPQDLGVAPFTSGAPGREFAAFDAVVLHQPPQGLDHDGVGQPQRMRGLFCGEGAVGAGIAEHEIFERRFDGFEERYRDTHGERDAERIPEACRVFDRGIHLSPADPNFERTPLSHELIGPSRRDLN